MYTNGLGQGFFERVGESIKREAEAEMRRFIEDLTGQAYEAVPPETRAYFEREYIERRLAEEAARAKEKARAVLPALLTLGALFLVAIPGRR